jgi:hypothetical protein
MYIIGPGRRFSSDADFSHVTHGRDILILLMVIYVAYALPYR